MRLLTALLAVALSACATVTPEERAYRVMAKYGPTCEAFGIPKGSPNFPECVVTLYRQDDAANQARATALMGAGFGLMAAQPYYQAPPKPVICTPISGSYICQ